MSNLDEKQQSNIKENEKKLDLNAMFIAKNKRNKLKRILKKFFIIALIIFLFIFLKTNSNDTQSEQEFNFEECKAEYGNVNVTVEGDGTITANSIYNITPKVTGEILKDICDKYVYAYNINLQKQLNKVILVLNWHQ